MAQDIQKCKTYLHMHLQNTTLHNANNVNPEITLKHGRLFKRKTTCRAYPPRRCQYSPFS